DPGATTTSKQRVTATVAMQSLAFWQLAGSFFTCGFSMSLLSAHGVPMLTDHGYTPMFASWALGVLGGSSIGGTVLLGLVSDRLVARRRAVRSHRWLRRHVRDRVRLPLLRLRRQPAHRHGRAAGLARRSRNELTVRRINVTSGRSLESLAHYSRAVRVGDTVL